MDNNDKQGLIAEIALIIMAAIVLGSVMFYGGGV
jgi:hypothetical protein